MKDLIKVIEALCEAYDNPKFKAEPNGKTHCDATADYVLQKFNVPDFKEDRIMANDIVRAMRTSPKFIKLSGSSQAQELANQGVLVLAGAEGIKHGHIAFVMPGRLSYSASWNKFAPKGMSNGTKEATFIGKRLSYAFRQEPEYFALEATV